MQDNAVPDGDAEFGPTVAEATRRLPRTRPAGAVLRHPNPYPREGRSELNKHDNTKDKGRSNNEPPPKLGKPKDDGGGRHGGGDGDGKGGKK